MSHDELDSSTGAGKVWKDAICSQYIGNCGKRRPREKVTRTQYPSAINVNFLVSEPHCDV